MFLPKNKHLIFFSLQNMLSFLGKSTQGIDKNAKVVNKWKREPFSDSEKDIGQTLDRANFEGKSY